MALFDKNGNISQTFFLAMNNLTSYSWERLFLRTTLLQKVLLLHLWHVLEVSHPPPIILEGEVRFIQHLPSCP